MCVPAIFTPDPLPLGASFFCQARILDVQDVGQTAHAPVSGIHCRIPERGTVAGVGVPEDLLEPDAELGQAAGLV